MTDALPPRRERFAREYVIDLNGTQAAIRAGYAPKAAHVTACRLLKDAKVAARIAELQAAAAKRNDVSADEVVLMLRKSYDDAAANRQFGPSVRSAELLGKTLGLFRDQVTLTPEAALSDDELVAKLAGNDPRKAAALRAILGPADSFDNVIGFPDTKSG